MNVKMGVVFSSPIDPPVMTGGYDPGVRRRNDVAVFSISFTNNSRAAYG